MSQRLHSLCPIKHAKTPIKSMVWLNQTCKKVRKVRIKVRMAAQIFVPRIIKTCLYSAGSVSKKRESGENTLSVQERFLPLHMLTGRTWLIQHFPHFVASAAA